MNAVKLSHRFALIVRLAAPVTLVVAVSACGARTEDGLECTADPPPVPSGAACLSIQTVELNASCVEGQISAERCKELCNATFQAQPCSVVDSTTPGKVVLLCPPTCVSGRRPAGFVAGERAGAELRSYLAHASELEAAAVVAFRRLRVELHRRGAPRSLLRSLSRAAREERRHARSTSALARRRGARPAKPQISPPRDRSLEAIAIENVTEGCVRELYGALAATFQAHNARDPEIQRLMRRIAHEETRHAALSMKVQRWLEQRLDRAAQARVDAARGRAIRELSAELRQGGDPALARAAGLPSPSEARRLLAALEPWFGTAQN